MTFFLEIDGTKHTGLIKRLFSHGMCVDCIQSDGETLCNIAVRNEKSIDWLRIASMMSGGDQIIVQKGIKVPNEAKLCMPDAESAMRQLLMSGVYEVVRTSRAGGAKLHALLIDRSAEFPAFAYELTPMCERMSILTDQAEAYYAYSDMAQFEYGIAPIIVESADNLPACDIIIAPYGISGCGALPLPKMIFAPSGSDCVSVSEDGIRLTREFCGISVKKYDVFMLCAAIFGNKNRLDGEVKVTSMKWRDRNSSVDELASIFYA